MNQWCRNLLFPMLIETGTRIGKTRPTRILLFPTTIFVRSKGEYVCYVTVDVSFKFLIVVLIAGSSKSENKDSLAVFDRLSSGCLHATTFTDLPTFACCQQLHVQAL